MTALLTRVRRLEDRAGTAGGCPVCRGEPPWRVRFDGQPPSGEPCPGCGGLRVIEVRYVQAGPPRGAASAASRAQ